MTEERTIASIVDDVAAGLEGIEVADDDGARSWSVGGRAFARETSGGLELGLDPAVAAAALRTADTHPSHRGPGWISFRPAELDRFAEDRVRAWFALAARLAGDEEPRAQH